MKYRGLLFPMILAAMCGDDTFMLNTKRGKGMQSTYRREKIVRKGAPACEGMRSLYLYNA